MMDHVCSSCGLKRPECGNKREQIALDGGNAETVTSPEKHIKTTSLIFLFGFFLIMINSVWDMWLPYGGYLFFLEVLAFCAVVTAKNYMKSY